MPVGETSQHQHGQGTRPPQSYTNNVFWETNHQLPQDLPHDLFEGSELPPEVSDTASEWRLR